MEFIEAKINPNSTLKMLSKGRGEVPKYEGKLRIKGQKSQTRTAPRRSTPGTAVPGGTVRQCQGARSCHLARPGRATLLAGLCWVASWAHGPCARLLARVLPVSRVLSAALLFLVFGPSSIL